MAETLKGEISGLHPELYRAHYYLFLRKDMGFGTSVLIIGDERNLRTTLAAIFQRAGYVITTSGNAVEAIQYLNEKCFDLVILDLKMTELNRVELLPEIKQRYPDIPVIMLTSLALSEALEHTDGLAIAEYLVKPLDPARIVAFADEVIMSSRYIQYNSASPKDAHPAPDNMDLLNHVNSV
jgi:DNA-binding NtrC family response regulator